MTTKRPVPDVELRKLAEASLQGEILPSAMPQSEHETLRLLHELQVYEIELAMQNEELRDAQAEIEEGLARFAEFYDFSPVGFVSLRPNGSITQINLAGARLLGRARALLMGDRLMFFIKNADQTNFSYLLQQVFATNTKQTCEVALAVEDTFPIFVQIEAILSDNQQECRAVLVDITARKLAEVQQRLAALVYSSVNVAIMVVDINDSIVAINPAFTELTGYSEKESIGHQPKIFKLGRHEADFYQSMRASLDSSGQWKGEIWNRRKNGEFFLEWMSISTVYDEYGAVKQRVGMFFDITDQKMAEQTIWQHANFDSLTGLPNRRMFYERLEQDIRKAQNTDALLALMFLDLDHFKEVNDTLGHDIGDLLLKEAAQRVSSSVRSADTVARLGGDEFTLILTTTEGTAVIDRIANDILAKLAQPFQLDGEKVYISASIGITLYPEDTLDIQTLIKNADQAMYSAKRHGRNRYHYFTPLMQERTQVKMQVSNDLRSALVDNQFVMYYQPILDLATGAIHKAEALIRWLHPKYGLVGPADFIAIAEETGLIVEMGDWVFLEVARQTQQWRKLYDPNFQISFNMSPVQFHNEKTNHENWFEYLHTLGLPGKSMVVEITEGLLLDASPIVAAKLLAFHNAGLQISLDDFGTGYSSLSYLNKFDIDYLKIDQSFVKNLTPNSSDIVLCEAITVMAHKLGIQVIAEGIESAGQHELLTKAGCDFGQGYLFSRPLPAKEFEDAFFQKPK